jgi:hypothetical protein
MNMAQVLNFVWGNSRCFHIHQACTCEDHHYIKIWSWHTCLLYPFAKNDYVNATWNTKTLGIRPTKHMQSIMGANWQPNTKRGASKLSHYLIKK